MAHMHCNNIIFQYSLLIAGILTARVAQIGAHRTIEFTDLSQKYTCATSFRRLLICTECTQIDFKESSHEQEPRLQDISKALDKETTANFDAIKIEAGSSPGKNQAQAVAQGTEDT